VINCQVITESGVTLGRVLGFSFDIETGDLSSLVIGALGVPLLGEGVLSTWELAVGEIVSSGTDRIIVYEGAEEKLRQLGTGLLEKLGIGGSSWEQEERERFRSGMIPAENQLPAGTPSALEQRRIQPATSRAVLPESELDYVELEERREREPLRQRLYLDEEDRDPTPPRRRDPYADPYGDEAYGGDGYGERVVSAAGYGEPPEARSRWREPEREPGPGAPLRRPEPDPDARDPANRFEAERISQRRVAEGRLNEDGQAEAGGRFQQRSWREQRETDGDAESPAQAWRLDQSGPSAPNRQAAEPGERNRPTGDERPRFEPEPRRRSQSAAQESTDEASGQPDWSPQERQPLEASAPPARPSARARFNEPAGGIDAESRRDSDIPQRARRPLSTGQGGLEPIDVEPEVLDDPW